MKKKSLIKLMIITIALLSFALTAAACTDGVTDEDKPVLAESVAMFTSSPNKKAVSDVTFGFTHYTASGTPVLIVESMHAERSQMDGYIYANGNIYTSTPMNAAGVLYTIINGNILPKDIKGFIQGDGKIYFEAGSYGGTLNVRGDIGTEADYLYTFEDKTYKTWGVLKESDAESYINDAERPSIANMKVQELLMTPLMLNTFDWGTAGDTSGAKINKGTKQYGYNYDASEALVKQYIVQQIDIMLEETFPTAEDKASDDYKEIKNLYDNYLEMVLSWISFSTFKMTVTADEAGRMTASETTVAMKLRVKEADVKRFMIEQNININLDTDGLVPGYSDVAGIDQLVSMIKVVFSAPNRESGVFQFDFNVHVAEAYSYGDASIDTASPMFKPYDADEPARFKLKYAASGDSEYRRWSILDFAA
ncbi:MAG: hypothetical protein LBT55_01880 [Clostridiaceae bacterium]|jgi:hypothetical protein|nr:hypothetical protein [Clostridiaceae bacterium]